MMIFDEIILIHNKLNCHHFLFLIHIKQRKSKIIKVKVKLTCIMFMLQSSTFNGINVKHCSHQQEWEKRSFKRFSVHKNKPTTRRICS